jgi:hypothetical protein
VALRLPEPGCHEREPTRGSRRRARSVLNNVMAPAFGALIVLLLMTGSLWIMANLKHNMMPIDQIMQMQR